MGTSKKSPKTFNSLKFVTQPWPHWLCSPKHSATEASKKPMLTLWPKKHNVSSKNKPVSKKNAMKKLHEKKHPEKKKRKNENYGRRLWKHNENWISWQKKKRRKNGRKRHERRIFKRRK